MEPSHEAYPQYYYEPTASYGHDEQLYGQPCQQVGYSNPPPIATHHHTEVTDENATPAYATTLHKTRRSGTSKVTEKTRQVAISAAFVQLQHLIPHTPVRQKLPKIKTLRLATRYINHLTSLLREDNVVSTSGGRTSVDFSRIVAAEVQSRNNYKEKADRLLNDDRLIAQTYTHKQTTGSSAVSSTSSPPSIVSSNQNAAYATAQYSCAYAYDARL